MHPRILLETLSRREVMQWLAYYNLEPWGEHRADMRTYVATRYTLLPHGKRGSVDPLPRFTYPYFETHEDAEDTYEWCLRFHRHIEYDEQGQPHYKPGIADLFEDNGNGD